MMHQGHRSAPSSLGLAGSPPSQVKYRLWTGPVGPGIGRTIARNEIVVDNIR